MSSRPMSRDDQMERLVAFPYLRKLVTNEQGIGYTTITDSGLQHLAKLTVPREPTHLDNGSGAIVSKVVDGAPRIGTTFQ